MRTIREETAARLALDAALGRWARTIDAWEAVTWVIARDAEIGTPLSERGALRAYTFDGVRSLDLPTVTVLYEVTEEVIVVHAARFVESRHRDAGRA